MRTSTRILVSLLSLVALASALFGQAMFFSQNKAASGGGTLYYGYGCTGSSTNTCSTFSALAPPGNFGYAVGTAFTTGADASGYTVKACGLSFSTAAGAFQCAVYLYNPTIAGFPVTNCVTTGATNAASGWTENTNFSSCTLAANTNYIIAFEQSSASAGTARASGGNQGYATAAYGTWGLQIFNTSPFSNALYVRVTAN